MKEIKFRAYSESFKKMFDNNHLRNVAEQMIGITDKWLKVNVPNSTKIKGGIFLPLDDDDLIFMQYTGLKDKNGKEIYEGDILLRDGGFQLIVSYKNGAYTRSYQNSNIYLLYDAFITDGCLVDYMVIGNIYENPELLDGVSND